MLLVLDTNVWLDLLVFRDPRVAALHAALRDGVAAAVTSAATRDELQHVLAYPALGLRDCEQRAAVAAAAEMSTQVDLAAPNAALPRCSDPDDQMFVELAAATGAALLTRDDALLRMAGRMRRIGVEVLTPSAWCAHPSGGPG